MTADSDSGQVEISPSETSSQADVVDELRAAPEAEDADGQPIWTSTPTNANPSRDHGAGPRSHPRCRQPPRSSKAKPFAPRPSRQEVERRVAEAQLWIAQRLPLIEIRANARQNWGITNVRTVSRYLSLARERMVQELITDRRRHQAEQIFALNDCARRAMDAGQFNAAVGAFRVIAEIGGLLRAPIKPPDAKS